MKSALILYPNQLFPLANLPDVQTIFFVEEPLLFGVDQQTPLKLHKQKMILLRAAARRYAEEVLWPAGYKVEYIELDVLFSTADILDKTKSFDQLYVFDPVDQQITSRLLEKRRSRSDLPPLEFLPSPNFYLKDQEVRDYFGTHHKHIFSDFYQWQRERFNILIGDDYKPVGGGWIIDEAAQAVPTGQVLPSFAVYGDNKFVQEATNWVNQHFGDHPGSTDFVWPTNHQEALAWLQSFLDNRLEHFATYYSAIDGQAAWLYHSALAPSLNIGLLSPQEVIEAALQQHRKKPVPLASLELFVRLILGQREFVRGQFITQYDNLRQDGFKHQRRLTPDWYNGTLGLPPFDDVVHKLQARAYAHPIERSAIIGGLMIMAEIQLVDIQTFFQELSLDNYDWNLLPNVAGLGHFMDDELQVSPSINPSTFLLQQSHYERGDWCDTWDGLFWRFVEKHKEALSKNSYMRPTVQRLARLDLDRKRIIGYRAEDFLRNFTR